MTPWGKMTRYKDRRRIRGVNHSALVRLGEKYALIESEGDGSDGIALGQDVDWAQYGLSVTGNRLIPERGKTAR